jgi:hypothetical protein
VHEIIKKFKKMPIDSNIFALNLMLDAAAQKYIYVVCVKPVSGLIFLHTCVSVVTFLVTVYMCVITLTTEVFFFYIRLVKSQLKESTTDPHRTCTI